MIQSTKQSCFDLPLNDSQDVMLPKLTSNKTIDRNQDERYMPTSPVVMHMPNNYGAHTFLHDLTTTKPAGNFLSTARTNNAALLSPGVKHVMKSNRDPSTNMMRSYFEAKKQIPKE
jgi:hypothetical protein